MDHLLSQQHPRKTVDPWPAHEHMVLFSKPKSRRRPSSPSVRRLARTQTSKFHRKRTVKDGGCGGDNGQGLPKNEMTAEASPSSDLDAGASELQLKKISFAGNSFHLEILECVSVRDF
ncbi:hypothetical protein NL676_016818 [Syzygium grande]|nr:hypothetical protein NL676_016818 [Syzygium grande]